MNAMRLNWFDAEEFSCRVRFLDAITSSRAFDFRRSRPLRPTSGPRVALVEEDDSHLSRGERDPLSRKAPVTSCGLACPCGPWIKRKTRGPRNVESRGYVLVRRINYWNIFFRGGIFKNSFPEPFKRLFGTLQHHNLFHLQWVFFIILYVLRYIHTI